MSVIADIKCYLCGHISGELRAESRDALAFRAFPWHPAPDGQGLIRYTCARCGGSVHLEDVREVREPEVVPIERSRRGRPPRSVRPLSLAS